jgi:photosystem II stability/assembly factor-like uncharacterized protein
MKAIFIILVIISLVGVSDAQPNWVQTNGPNGGYIVKIIVDSSDNYYAGTDQNGIYRSTNLGASWEDFDQGFPNDINVIRSMACISDTEILASASWNSTQNCRLSLVTGVWNKIFLKFLPYPFHSIFKSKKNTIFVGIGKLLRSDNSNYDTLYRSDSGIVHDNIVSINGTPDGELYLSANTSLGRNGSGIYRSLDDGKSWQRILDTIAGGTILGCMYTTKSQEQKNVVYAGVINISGSWSGLLRTTNDGASWDTLLINHSIYDVVTVDSVIFASVQYGGIYRSSDNGLKWRLINQGLTYFPEVRSLTVTKTKAVLAATYGGGIYILYFGDSIWHNISKGLPFTSVRSIALESTDTIYAGTTFTGVNISTDKGNSWMQSSSGISAFTISSLIATRKHNLYAGTEDGVYFSFDHSKTWHKVRGINTNVNAMQLSDHSVYVCVNDSNFYVQDGDTIAHLLQDNILNTTISSITEVSNHNLYAFGSWQYQPFPGGFNATVSGVLFSNGNNSGFVNVNPSAYPFYPSFEGGHIGSLGNILFNIYNGLIQRSDNFGANWTSGISFRHDNTNGFATINDKIFVGTGYDGILLSPDSGTTWQSLNSGLTNGTVNCIARDSFDFLYLGSENAVKTVKGGGVFRSTLPGNKLGVKYRVQTKFDASKLIITSNSKFIRLQEEELFTLKIVNLVGKEIAWDTNLFLHDQEINIYDLLKTDGFYSILLTYRSGKASRFLIIRM